MSQNDDRCPTGKRCYVNRHVAKHSANIRRAQGLGKMTVYLCPHCDYFHHGHAAADRKESIREYRRATAPG